MTNITSVQSARYLVTGVTRPPTVAEFRRDLDIRVSLNITLLRWAFYNGDCAERLVGETQSQSRRTYLTL